MDLREPLLAPQGDDDLIAASPSGRGLSVAALAPMRSRRSASSLRSVATQPSSASPGRDSRDEILNDNAFEEAASQRTTTLRFAPVPRGFSSGLGSSRVSSPACGSIQGRGGLRAGSYTSGGGGRDAASVLHRTASTKLLQLSAAYQSRKKLEEAEGFRMPKWVIHPYDVRANFWWAFIALAVLVTMAAEPAFLAFAPYPGFYPLTSPDTIITALLITAYALDIALNFFVAYHDEDGALVVDRRMIAKNYAHWRLWVDLATTIPFDWIVLGALGLRQSATVQARYISLLRLIRLGRVYRLQKWAVYLTTNASVSLFWVTICRNVLVLFYSTHIGACVFFYLARQTEGAVVTWLTAAHDAAVGGAGGMPDGLSVFGKYIFSLYWSAVTFATVGYGDIHAETVPEAAFIVLFIYLNVFIGAYIIGTITLLVTRADEETGRYRSELAVLEQYGHTHQIPQEMQSAMRGHLRLHYSAQEASDERVLAVLPSALRRRVLGHMYSGVLEDSWLLEGCHQKFLDAFLGAAKMEHVMPKVEIVSEGDLVNELMILVAGTCVVEAPRPGGTGPGSDEHVILSIDNESVHGGAARPLGPGEPLAEMAFFTETANLQTYRTLTVCRVLSLSRTAFMALVAAFPISAERILGNLLEEAQGMVSRELHVPAAALESLGAASSLDALSIRYASQELYTGPAGSSPAGGSAGGACDGNGSGAVGGGAAAAAEEGILGAFAERQGRPLRQSQRMALSNLVRVRLLVEAQRQRLQRERTAEFLEAAAQGNASRLRAMLQQGLSPDSADYDGRTALMLAAAHGHAPAAALLIAAGADPSLQDALQGCALLEAARGGHDAVLEALLQAGARMSMSQVACAAHLCTAVFEGDVPLLRRLIKAGMDPDAGDYDGRRAAHIAAAESSLPALKVLAEEAQADMGLKDRWGMTPLDEARRGGAAAAVAYLERLVGTLPPGAGAQQRHQPLGVSF